MDLILFLLVNLTFFIRPSELIPELATVPIYLSLILLAMAASAQKIVKHLQDRPFFQQPITVCVLGIWLAVVLSHAGYGRTMEARTYAVEFGKVVIYYLIAISVLDTPQRLKSFLSWLLFGIFLLAGLALLHFHGFVNIPALQALDRLDRDPDTGEIHSFRQLRSTGIFNDPNDLSLMLVPGVIFSMYRMFAPGAVIGKLVFGSTLVGFLYAIYETKSRGGFLAVVAGVYALMLAKYGLRKASGLAVVVVPLMAMLFGGRQTQISTGAGTAQDRIRLWNEGLMLLRSYPLFGIGADNYDEFVGQDAHNSYVHAFTELGLVGGIFFAGLFYYSIMTARTDGLRDTRYADPETQRLQAYMVAGISAYAVGIYSLSRCYVNPTYLLPALVCAYHRVSVVAPIRTVPKFSARVIPVGLGVLAFLYVFVKVFVRYGG